MKFKSYDDYIDASADFSRPILTELRSIVHEACPDVIEEFKWSFPNFTYKGKILCHMAAFKAHASFGFWLGPLMTDSAGLFMRDSDTGMGHFGKIKSLSDLPERALLINYIHEAVNLIDQGKTITSKKIAPKQELIIPSYLSVELELNEAASVTFDNFSYSHKKEYIEWITEAKTEPTRLKRLAQTIEWLSEGKSRNWKYSKK